MSVGRELWRADRLRAPRCSATAPIDAGGFNTGIRRRGRRIEDTCLVIGRHDSAGWATLGDPHSVPRAEDCVPAGAAQGRLKALIRNDIDWSVNYADTCGGDATKSRDQMSRRCASDSRHAAGTPPAKPQPGAGAAGPLLRLGTGGTMT